MLAEPKNHFSRAQIVRTNGGRAECNFLLLLLAAVFSLAAAANARADLIATEPLSDFGTLSQLNSGVIDLTGSNALRENSCVPTSVANGLTFLSNYYSNPGLVSGYSTVNTLSTLMGTSTDGTTFSGMAAGTSSYLASLGPAGSTAMAGMESPPFIITLYDWLLADYAVEFWISWDKGGAHSVTLYGIDIATDPTGMFLTGGGTLSFIDPYGGTPLPGGNSESAVVVPDALFETVGLMSAPMLHIYGGYTVGAAFNPSDPDNPAKSGTGIISNALAEKNSPGGSIPEPSSIALLAAGVIGIVPNCFRRQRAARLAKRTTFPRADDPAILSFPSHSSPSSAARRAA
jgi:hypothetical protein